VRYVVLTWLCAAAAIAYVSRNSLGVAEKTIREELGWEDRDLFGLVLTPKDQMAWVMSAFFLSYTLFQLPAGWLSHVWGTRRALPVFSAAWSLTTALLAVAPGWGLMLLSRFGMGAAQAGLFVCTTNSNARWFPLTGRALPSGALGSMMSLGGALATFLTGQLLQHYGAASWRWVFAAYSLPGLLWAGAFYLWFRDDPRDHAAVNEAERDLIGCPPPRKTTDPDAISRTPWRGLLSSPAMWWICGQQLFRAAAYMFFASWFPTYLQETRRVAIDTAGVQGSLPLLAVVVGGLAGGAVSDAVLTRTGSRRLARQGVAVVSLVLCTLLILPAPAVANTWLAVLLISGGSFCAAVAGPCAYTITIDMGGRHVSAVFSLMNMAGNFGAFVFPIVVPWMVRRTGDWDAVLYLFAAMYFAAALCWLLVRPDGTVLDQSLAKPDPE
jgi:ACS family glucarate transporter-like MFS transporter